MTTNSTAASGRRSFVARLLAGAGALAAAVGTSWGASRPPRTGAGPSAGLRVRPHPDAVPRTQEQSMTNG